MNKGIVSKLKDWDLDNATKMRIMARVKYLKDELTECEQSGQA